MALNFKKRIVLLGLAISSGRQSDVAKGSKWLMKRLGLWTLSTTTVSA
jgi:hypothetical protein